MTLFACVLMACSLLLFQHSEQGVYVCAERQYRPHLARSESPRLKPVAIPDRLVLRLFLEGRRVEHLGTDGIEGVATPERTAMSCT